MFGRSRTLIPPTLTALVALSMAGPTPAQTAPATGGPKSGAQVAAAREPTSDRDVALARKAAVAWLALADAGKFAATWDEAAASFQKGQKKEEWSKGLGSARQAMGKMISRTFLNHQVRTVLPKMPPGRYITIRFETVFERRPKSAESVTLVQDDARGFRMTAYFLQ
jgi:hypothetical protein